jgi:DNA polymerase III epsilon subunit family exonuclease
VATIDFTNSRFAFLDLETTGLSPWFGDRICEVGIVVCQGRRIKRTYGSIINPERALSLAAASTSNIAQTALHGAPVFGQIAEDLAAFLDDTIVVCHNAGFELQFLDSELRRVGRDLELPNLIDTLHLARENFELPSYSLASLAEAFGVRAETAGRALPDALVVRAIFFALMDALKPRRRPLDDYIGIYSSPAWPSSEIQLPIELGEAIASGRRLLITYVDSDGERTVRWITPQQVLGLADYIYLQAFCHLRRDERSFRLDRIVELRVEV